MYYDFSVPVPKEKGKILFKKKGNSSYVLYEYEREYKKDKQYVIPKRSIIGKLLSDNSERMFPNE
ncbi:hypothetical protein, partial [Ruminobacter sp. RM87]